MKTVKLKFITETGKSFYVSMDYAAPTLAEPEGAAKVQAAVDLILEQQPFAVVLESIKTPGENRKRRTPQKQWTKS